MREWSKIMALLYFTFNCNEKTVISI